MAGNGYEGGRPAFGGNRECNNVAAQQQMVAFWFRKLHQSINFFGSGSALILLSPSLNLTTKPFSALVVGIGAGAVWRPPPLCGRHQRTWLTPGAAGQLLVCCRVLQFGVQRVAVAKGKCLCLSFYLILFAHPFFGLCHWKHNKIPLHNKKKRTYSRSFFQGFAFRARFKFSFLH